MSIAEGKRTSAQGSNYQENMTAPPFNEGDGIASDEGADDQDTIPQKADSVLSAIEKVSLLCSCQGNLQTKRRNDSKESGESII